MKKSIHIFSLIFILVHNIALNASNVEFYNYNINDGLSQSTVRSIYQDSKGFLWFGTQEGGLNRFDGNEFMIYRHDPNDTTSISSNKVFKIIEDHKENLWLATSSGVCKYSKYLNRFTSYVNYSSEWQEVSNTINDICFDDDGNFWIAASNGLFCLSGTTQKFLHKFNTLIFVRSIYKDRHGALWIGTQEGLFLFNKTANELVLFSAEGPLPRNINQVYGDSENRIWISTITQGLFCLDNPAKEKFDRYIHDPLDNNSINSNEVRCVLEGGKNTIWVGTDKGLNLIQVNSKTITRYYEDDNNPFSLSKNSVYSLYKDENNKVWVGTWNGGVNYIASKDGRILHESHRINDEESLNNNTVKCFYPEENGVWIGTQKGGLNYFNKQTGKYSHYMSIASDKNTIASNHIFSIEKDPSGNMWIGTNNGLSYFNTRTKKFSNHLNGQRVLKVLYYKENKLWVCFADEISLMDMEKGEIIHTPINEKNKKVYGSNLQLIFTYKNGKTRLVSTQGVFEYNASNGEFELISMPEIKLGEKFRVIYCTHTDKFGTIWIGSGTGLHFLKENQKTIQSVVHDKGALITEVKGILDDKRGNLWLSTNSGIYKFNPQTKSTVHFSVNDGLQSNEFINTSCAKNANGEMYFGGINGFNVFHPDMLKFDDAQIKTVLVGFRLFNKEVEIGTESSPLKRSITHSDEITLNHKQNVFTITYSALYYDKRRNQRYAYKLVGYDKNWNYVNNKRTASYMNLPPGEYHFLVKSTNENGSWSNSNAALTINVLPPYWKTWWFISICIILIVCGAILFFYWRTQQMRKRNEELEHEVGMRTREIKRNLIILREQADELNATNTELEERQQRIEEQAEELMVQKETLEEQRDQLREVNSVKDKLFSIVAHDLKNPFTTLMGFLELLNIKYEKYTDEKRKAMIEHATNSAKNIQTLLLNLLSWARSQGGTIRFRPEVVDIVEIVKSNIRLVTNQAAEKNITIQFPQTNSFISLNIDDDLINTVVRNLLTNAIKFTPSEGFITLNCTDSDKHVICSVKDSGIGISPENLKKLFKKDTHFTTYGTNNETGTGLGLITCKDFIEMHNGTITVDSEEGKGTTFTIVLPKNEIFDTDQ